MDSLERLIDIMAELRHPERGCPWDREQDFSTIAPYTIEEAYEVADAIERQDMSALQEELGDLLFQVIYHARLASEAGLFEFRDVVHSITGKLKRRHPHVFGNEKIDTADQQSRRWEQLKRMEDEASAKKSSFSLLDDIPVALSALLRAQKIQARVATVGFDWGSITPVLDKIREELDELEAEITAHADNNRLNEELGDLIFSCVNLGRHLGINAEGALRTANRKFTSRFQYMESSLGRNGKLPGEVGPAVLERLWQAAKRE